MTMNPAPALALPMTYPVTRTYLAYAGYTPTLVKDLMTRAVRQDYPPVSGGRSLAYHPQNHYWHLTNR